MISRLSMILDDCLVLGASSADIKACVLGHVVDSLQGSRWKLELLRHPALPIRGATPRERRTQDWMMERMEAAPERVE